MSLYSNMHYAGGPAGLTRYGTPNDDHVTFSEAQEVAAEAGPLPGECPYCWDSGRIDGCIECDPETDWK